MCISTFKDGRVRVRYTSVKGLGPSVTISFFAPNRTISRSLKTKIFIYNLNQAVGIKKLENTAIFAFARQTHRKYKFTDHD